MRTSKHICSTSAALHRIFIAPNESSPRQFTRAISTQYTPKYLPQRRNYATPSKPNKSRLPRDEEITAYSVQLVNEEGKLSEARQTASILKQLNPKTESLVMVAAASLPNSHFPICKIVNKAAVLQAEREKKKAAKENKDPTKTCKTLELNWVIEKNDLAHRMDKMKTFLRKGWRVDVVLAKKRKGKVASLDQAKELVSVIRGVIEEGGWKEWKGEDGKLLGSLSIFIEGKKEMEKEV